MYVPRTIFLVEVVVDDGRYFSVWRQFAHHSPPIHKNFVVLRLMNINYYYFSIVVVGENGLFAIVLDDGGVGEVKPRELAQPLEEFGLASNGSRSVGDVLMGGAVNGAHYAHHFVCDSGCAVVVGGGGANYGHCEGDGCCCC